MIIECEFCKCVFDIPNKEIGVDGRDVKCSFCEGEWFQNNISADIPLPEKVRKGKIVAIKKKKNQILLRCIILLIILFIGLLSNQNIILSKYPYLGGFYESADILKEIVIQNISWVKEILQNIFEL